MQVEVGKIYAGKVTGITSFGAFVQLDNGQNGLVHISEVAHDYVKSVEDHLQVGNPVKVKVLSIDANGKVSFSIKKALPKPDVGGGAPGSSGKPSGGPLSFEDMMTKFKTSSDEKMRALNRNAEPKRKGYRKAN